MSTESAQITVNGVVVTIVRKGIKNLHLGVYPPQGRVRVAAPHAITDAAVRLAVIGKLGWIRRQKLRFTAQPRQSEREMVSGESHYVFGHRYRLQVIEHQGAGRITIRNRRFIDLYARPGLEGVERKRILHRWYRDQLRQHIQPLMDRWQAILGVEASGFSIKRMKTKWGSCNQRSRRIWLNLELAKKPKACLEYLVVHELLHLVERHHNDHYLALMDQHLPTWRNLRDLLNSEPLAHEEWLC